MRPPNVLINIRERGKLVGKRRVHNVWVDRGREYLAEMVGYATLTPDSPERSDRIRHLGVGVGGFQQTMSPLPAAVETAYPAGSDPLSTAGNEYREDFPYVGGVSLTTLERPVRVTGGSNPYGSAVPSDQWLVDETSGRFFTTHATLTEVTVHAIIAATAGDVVYSPFALVPISEAGLFTSEVSPTGTPFSTLVAYAVFDTISLNDLMDIEFIWSVKF